MTTPSKGSGGTEASREAIAREAWEKIKAERGHPQQTEMNCIAHILSAINKATEELRDEVGIIGRSRDAWRKLYETHLQACIYRAAQTRESMYDSYDRNPLNEPNWEAAQPQEWTGEWVKDQVGHFSIMKQKYARIAELHNATLI